MLPIAYGPTNGPVLLLPFCHFLHLIPFLPNPAALRHNRRQRYALLLMLSFWGFTLPSLSLMVSLVLLCQTPELYVGKVANLSTTKKIKNKPIASVTLHSLPLHPPYLVLLTAVSRKSQVPEDLRFFASSISPHPRSNTLHPFVVPG